MKTIRTPAMRLWALLIPGLSMCTPSEPVVLRAPPPLPAPPPAAPAVVQDEHEQTDDFTADDQAEVAYMARQLEMLLPSDAVVDLDIEAELTRAVILGGQLKHELDEFGNRLERKMTEAAARAEARSARRARP